MFGQVSASQAALERSLDLLWQRQQLVMHNIANEDTPGFRAQRLAFQGEFSRAVSTRTNVSALGARGSALSGRSSVTASVVEDNRTIGRADGNNVDIDSELIEMARLQIQWQLATQRAGSHYQTLRTAITGGR